MADGATPDHGARVVDDKGEAIATLGVIFESDAKPVSAVTSCAAASRLGRKADFEPATTLNVDDALPAKNLVCLVPVEGLSLGQDRADGDALGWNGELAQRILPGANVRVFRRGLPFTTGKILLTGACIKAGEVVYTDLVALRIDSDAASETPAPPIGAGDAGALVLNDAFEAIGIVVAAQDSWVFCVSAKEVFEEFAVEDYRPVKITEVRDITDSAGETLVDALEENLSVVRAGLDLTQHELAKAPDFDLDVKVRTP